MNKAGFLFASGLLAAVTAGSVAQTPDLSSTASAPKAQTSSEGYVFRISTASENYTFGIPLMPGGQIFTGAQKNYPDPSQGRPHSATSGDDLRGAVPTLSRGGLILPCVLVTDDAVQNENGAASVYPLTMTLVLTIPDDTWMFKGFVRRHDQACDAEPPAAAKTKEAATAKSPQ